MAWPWQRRTEPTAPAPIKLRSRCPRCQSVEAVRVATLVSALVDEDGNIGDQLEGYRYACQRCPCVYSFSATGVFAQNSRSQPLTPEVPPSYEDVDQAPEGPPPPQRPLPKSRPRV